MGEAKIFHLQNGATLVVDANAPMVLIHCEEPVEAGSAETETGRLQRQVQAVRSAVRRITGER